MYAKLLRIPEWMIGDAVMQNISLKMQKTSYRTQEAYKSLRTNVEFCGEDVKVISITSCTPNEGKSSVAMGLAEAFGEAGKRTRWRQFCIASP